MSRTFERRIDVFFLVPSRNSKGGIGRLALYLDGEFRRRGDVRLRIVPTRSSERPLLKHLSTLPALLSFIGRCGAARERIVHINVAPHGSTYRKLLFWIAARSCRAKTVIHLHGSGYDDFFRQESRRQQQIIRRFFRGADHVVVLGEYWKAFVAEYIGVDEARISIVYNGVPEPEPSNEEKWDPPLIATMGLVGERKGTDVLVAALSALPASVDWRAVVGGNGEVEKYRDIAASAGLAGKIDFRGWMDEAEVDQWLHRASLFVLPSRAENQPVAILEAMARGVPVIATSIGAIPEQVVDDVTGILVSSGDAEALAAAIEKLLTSPDQRTAMGAAARRRYEERFSITHCANALAGLYRSLADSYSDRAAQQ